jgi:hypothetical protein
VRLEVIGTKANDLIFLHFWPLLRLREM